MYTYVYLAIISDDQHLLLLCVKSMRKYCVVSPPGDVIERGGIPLCGCVVYSTVCIVNTGVVRGKRGGRFGRSYACKQVPFTMF